MASIAELQFLDIERCRFTHGSGCFCVMAAHEYVLGTHRDAPGKTAYLDGLDNALFLKVYYGNIAADAIGGKQSFLVG